MLEGRTGGVMPERKDRRGPPDPARLAIIGGMRGWEAARGPSQTTTESGTHATERQTSLF
jgi:hypothetical protein